MTDTTTEVGVPDHTGPSTTYYILFGRNSIVNPGGGIK